MLSKALKIGTRGSPLALAQAHETRRRLSAALERPEDDFQIVVIKTTGDLILDRALSEAGGKGLFTKELDIAQLAGDIDIAVHSGKDLPTQLPDGVVLAGFLPREDVRDAFIGGAVATLEELPHGARVGTASLRRQALVKRLRPDLDVQLLRGNVQTRLSKVSSGEFAATLLALAGLKRLGLADKATSLLPLDKFPPACGQGAIAICARAGDFETLAALENICDRDTNVALAAERAFLAALDGSCRTPIAGHAIVEGENLSFHGMVLSKDGAQAFETRLSGPRENAGAMGAEAAQKIREVAPKNLLVF